MLKVNNKDNKNMSLSRSSAFTANLNIFHVLFWCIYC